MSLNQPDSETQAPDGRRDVEAGPAAPWHVLTGFNLVLAASVFWGVGNVVTRWTVGRVPHATFDVVLLKYLVAAALLVSVAFLLRTKGSGPVSWSRCLRELPGRWFVAASLAKGVNAYCWILAASLIPAGPVATLENLHIVWTALAVAVLFRERVSAKWIAGALATLGGASLVTGFGSGGSSSLIATGTALGLVAGLALATFVVIWNGLGDRPTLRERALVMGTLLLVSGLLLYPIHLLSSLLWVGSISWPLMEVGVVDGAVQCLNGLLGIGVTYFLFGEATSLLQRAGGLSSLLLAIGLSFAIPVTLLTEAVALGEPVSSIQWAGVVMFALGFVVVHSSLRRIR